METTGVANDNGTVRKGQIVWARGRKATVFEISVLGMARVKYLATGQKEQVPLSEIVTKEPTT